MPLNLLVCVKGTVSSTSGALRPEGQPLSPSPLDEYAVEEALRLKERVPGSKTAALSLGTPASEEPLRSVLSLGVESAVLLCDEAFAGGDPVSSAYLLSLAVRKLSAAAPVQLVLCGKKTNDGESGQVGPALAAWLGWPSACAVRKVVEVSETSLTVERALEGGVETLALSFPAVLTLTKEINEPRLPSLKGKMAARKAQIPRWGASDLGADAALYGKSAATSVVKTAPVPPRAGGVSIPGNTPEEKARALAEKLKEMKLL
ncbi:MAG TPA: electron transfer flavoprotein subunit beta [Elusimicrobia bacterium]|nr:electron transfer flavoprotein subunit beta [Elusimicrobiota bacterium]